MKKIFFVFISLSLLFFTYSCDKDLPYPIDQVKKGVVIDVFRIPGTDGLLSEGITTGNYKIRLTIPENQGDYSFMKNAQLLAVLLGTDGKRTSRVVIDDITQFPLEVNLNIADIYSKFGLNSPELGQILNLTANVVLNDGSVIPGWTEYAGFNNVAFAGWKVDGRDYSSNVRYQVSCPFNKDPLTGTFIGTFTCDESAVSTSTGASIGTDSYTVTLSHNSGLPPTIPAGVTAANLYGVNIRPISPNIWEPTNEVFTIWINSEDLSVIIPSQDTGDLYNGSPIMWGTFSGVSVNTCIPEIKFTMRATIPGLGLAYSYAFSFTIHP